MTELREEGIDEWGRRRFAAVAEPEGLVVARFVTSDAHGWLRVAVDDIGASLAQRRALIEAITARARAEQRVGVVLAATSHLLLRYAARAEGYLGAIRADLVLDLARRRPEKPPDDQFLFDLQGLLPGVTVVAADRHARAMRSFLRTLSTGMVGTVHLIVEDNPSAHPLELAVPVNADVMAEGVALTIDTALAVRRRFQPIVDQVRIFYDQPIQGLRSGIVAGLAEPAVRDIHLSPAYASANEMEALYGDRRDSEPTTMVLPPFTRVDCVVAHEYWHQIEFGLEGGRYRDSIEFRRALGGYFGVETLEHVIKGAGAGAPPAWQAARVRLTQEVSAYATTAPKEAAAELFAQWWCTPTNPRPSAVFFGEVLRRFFPAAFERR
jgi:hypothetical protein